MAYTMFILSVGLSCNPADSYVRSGLHTEEGQRLFETGFAQLFRAIDRIRIQLETADCTLRTYLAEELVSLKQLGEQYFDHWMALDDQIHELAETFGLQLQADTQDFTNSPSKSSAFVDSEQGCWHDAEDVKRTYTIDVRASRTGASMSLSNPPPAWECADYDWSDILTTSFRQGMAYYDLLMFDDAARLLEAVSLKVDEPIVQLYLAAAHAANGRIERASETLNKVRARATEEKILTATYEIEAYLYCSLQQLDQALACFTEVTLRNPSYSDAWFNQGICSFHLKDYERATSAFLQTLRLEPDDVEVKQYLAATFLAAGELRSAKQICQEALQQHSSHLGVLCIYSHVLTKESGQADVDGLAICERIRYVDSKRPQGYIHAAWYHLQLGHIDQARLILKKWLSIRPNHPDGLYHYGIACLLAEDYAVAEPILHAALIHHPDKSAIWIALGRISSETGDYEQAHRRFLRACADPRKPIKRLSLYYHALTLMEQKRFHSAEKHLKAAAYLGPPNSAILYALSVIAGMTGRTQEANTLAEKAKRLAGNTKKTSHTAER